MLIAGAFLLALAAHVIVSVAYGTSDVVMWMSERRTDRLAR